MINKRGILLLSVFAIVLTGFGTDLAVGEEPRVRASFGKQGLTSLKRAGTSLLANGTPQVNRVILEKKTRNDEGVNEYAFETIEDADPDVTFKRSKNRLTYGYNWGTVSFTYREGSDRLELTTTIRNTSDWTVAMFDVTPFRLSLPEKLNQPKDWNRVAKMPGEFNVVEATYGDRKLLLCGETVMPLHLGFGKPRNGDKELPVTLRGNVNILESGGVTYHHYGLPRVASGETLKMRMSLRFTKADQDTFDVASDMVQAFRTYHRPALKWTDRRPIGAIFLPSGRGPANNPRNWFKEEDLDVRTKEGKKKLREKFMKFAERSVSTLKKTNAQGMVLWNPEGGENPHPVTYIGDPRMVKKVAPELTDVYPDFFQKFRDAGLRTGVCIRPSQTYMTLFEQAVDGDVTSRWSVQQFPQWLVVDLGENRKIDRTELVCFNDRAYRFKIEAKPENGAYSTIVDRTDNTTPGTVDEPITDTFDPVKARYLKLTVTGVHEYDGSWCSILEFRAFSGDSKNLALNRAQDCSRRFGRTVGGHEYHYNPERNPLNDDFSDVRPDGVPAKRFFPIVERMSRKIDWAKEHWGCTLFYIDTNGVKRPVGEKQKIKWSLLGPLVWRDLQKRHPDVLLIPEFAKTPGQMAYTSTYLQPPYSSATLKDRWRKILPGVFGVSYTVNLKKEKWKKKRDELLKGIRAGDSMFFRGWFGDQYNSMINKLYDEVYQQDAINPGLPETYLNQSRKQK